MSTLAPKISNRPHAHTAFQNPPEDSRTLINVQSMVVRPAQDIMNVKSVVVNLRTLHSQLTLQYPFSITSAVLSRVGCRWSADDARE
jgi:hypothetical protein